MNFSVVHLKPKGGDGVEPKNLPREEHHTHFGGEGDGCELGEQHTNSAVLGTVAEQEDDRKRYGIGGKIMGPSGRQDRRRLIFREDDNVADTWTNQEDGKPGDQKKVGVRTSRP